MENYEFFNIPQLCAVKNTIFKKLFYENAELSPADKSLFTDVINKITWIYCLKPENINIQPYEDEVREYVEIEFIEVEISQDKRLNRIAEIIMRTIPYPMVLFFRLQEKLKFFVAHQKNNLNDSSKNTLEEIISTDLVDNNSELLKKLNIPKMSFSNFYNLYTDIVDAICIYNASALISSDTNISGEEARRLTSEIEELEKEMAMLKSRLKNESQFNKKMELNMEIKKMRQRKSQLTGGN